MAEQINYQKPEEQEGVDIQELLFKYLAYWKWIAASIVFCLICAFVYLRYSVPVYSVSSTVLLKDDKKGGGMDEMNALQDWGVISGKNNVDNEIEIFRSKNLIRMVVSDLKLYTKYYSLGHISSIDLYRKSPLLVDATHGTLDSLRYTIKLMVKMTTSGALDIDGMIRDKPFKAHFDKLPAVLQTSEGLLTLTKNSAVNLEKDANLEIYVSNPSVVARGYAARLGVAPTSKTTSVIQMSITEVNVTRGIDFLNCLVDMYNRDAIEDKNRVALNTEIFINDRLQKLNGELGVAERDLEKYKKQERITNIQADAQLALQENSEYKKKLVEVETQLNLANYLDDYMKKNSDKTKLVPANVGIQDQTLQALTQQYNTCLLEKDRLLQTSSVKNPAVSTLQNTINALYTNILSSLHSVVQGLRISKNDLERQAKIYSTRISTVPTVEREFTERSRQQLIKSELFLSLLKKREENSLALAVTANSAKVIDDASSSGMPISPKRKLIYMIALVLGFAIPVGVIYLLDILNYRVRNRKELERLTKVPILGDIPLVEESGDKIVVEANKNNWETEAFRSIRTNLQFILSNSVHKSVLVTSSLPTEGKSFISINLAISLALMEKKVLLLGLDVRKPTLTKYMKIEQKKGITSYLGGMVDSVEEITYSYGKIPGFDVIPTGPMPPNPAELLMSSKLDELMVELRESYDYIVIDSAPIGLVTDSFIISRLADATIYVARQNVAEKKNIEWLNDIVNKKRLPNVSLIFNGVEYKSSYGYGYGKKYGHNYGYNYGYSIYGKESKYKK